MNREILNSQSETTQDSQSFRGTMTPEERKSFVDRLIADLLNSDKDLVTINDKPGPEDPEKVAEDVRNLLKFLDTH